jgi:hypothetical protein
MIDAIATTGRPLNPSIKIGRIESKTHRLCRDRNPSGKNGQTSRDVRCWDFGLNYSTKENASNVRLMQANRLRDATDAQVDGFYQHGEAHRKVDVALGYMHPEAVAD